MDTIDPQTVVEINEAHHTFVLAVGLTHGLIPLEDDDFFRRPDTPIWPVPESMGMLTSNEEVMLAGAMFESLHPELEDTDWQEAVSIGHAVMGCDHD